MLRHTLSLLVLTTGLCAQTRYARLADVDGSVEAGVPAEPLERAGDLDHVFSLHDLLQEPAEARPAGFYDLFLDRGGWPEAMRRGYESTIGALRPFRDPTVNSRSGGADMGQGKSAP